MQQEVSLLSHLKLSSNLLAFCYYFTNFKCLYIVLTDPMNVWSFTSKRVGTEKVKRFLLNGTYYPYERRSHLTAFVKVR